MSQFIQQFQEQVVKQKSAMHAFLSDLEQAPLPHLDDHAEQLEKEVWAETDCLGCANCCRSMTPAFTSEDIKRIATHFRMSVAAFKAKWLYKTKTGAWQNRSCPCPFLDLQTNKCSIYAIRPADCAGFPHLTKKKTVDYLPMHKQNLAFCPATFKLIEKLMEAEVSLNGIE